MNKSKHYSLEIGMYWTNNIFFHSRCQLNFDWNQFKYKTIKHIQLFTYTEAMKNEEHLLMIPSKYNITFSDACTYREHSSSSNHSTNRQTCFLFYDFQQAAVSPAGQIYNLIRKIENIILIILKINSTINESRYCIMHFQSIHGLLIRFFLSRPFSKSHDILRRPTAI